MSLTEKYRPQAFSEVIGQPAVDIVKSYVGKKELPGLWIFYGPKGTGKTSLSRIFTMALNCTNLEADKNPCLQCESCKDIINRVSPDHMIEMDGASNRGIDDVRSIHKIAQMRTYGTKVIVIDEAHQLSDPAFNALLKLAESPPKGVILILVTTQIDKIIPTIRDRAVPVKFDRVNDTLLNRHLRQIAKLEGVETKLSSDAIDVIIKKADGSVRGLIKGLDVFVSMVADGKVDQFSSVYAGAVEDRYEIDLVKNFLEKKIAPFSETIEKMKQSGYTPVEIILRLYSGLVTVALRNVKNFKGVKDSELFAGLELSREQFQWFSSKMSLWIPLVQSFPDYNLVLKLLLEFVIFW